MKTIESPLVSIKLAKETLTHEQGSHEDAFVAILQEFTTLLHRKLQFFRSELEKSSQSSLATLDDRIGRLNDVQVNLVLLAPEVSFRLLRFDSVNIIALSDFLIRCFDAEQAKAHHEFDTALYDELWTPNGDFFIRYDKKNSEFVTYEQFKLNNITPIDFFSPFCVRLTNDDIGEDRASTIHLYDFEEAERVLELLEGSAGPIMSSDNNYIRLINMFSRVIIFNKVINSKGLHPFISGSDALHVGRTVISNIDQKDVENLAEALVHESIHSVLYMVDETNRWMPSYDLSNSIGRIVPSFWTGNRLTMNSLLQACFVWYGLYHFWVYAKKNGGYDAAHVDARITFIKNGFSRFSIDELTRTCPVSLNPVLVESLNEIIAEMARSTQGS